MGAGANVFGNMQSLQTSDLASKAGRPKAAAIKTRLLRKQIPRIIVKTERILTKWRL
jgi:hypothetical protein